MLTVFAGIKAGERKERGLFCCVVFPKTLIIHGDSAAKQRGRVSAAPCPLAGGRKIVEKQEKQHGGKPVSHIQEGAALLRHPPSPGRPPSYSLVSFDQLATHSRQSPQDPRLFFHYPTPSFNLPTPSLPSAPNLDPGPCPLLDSGH